MLLVFIRRWGRLFTCCICSTLIRCYWWISILIIIPVVRWCFLIGPHKSAVLLFDRGYPSFGNVDSAIPIDVVGLKSYMDSLFDPTCVPVGVTINKLNLAPNSNMPRFVSVFRNRRGLSTSKPYFVFFYPFSNWSPSFTDVHFAAFAWDLIDDTVFLWWF